MFDRHRESVVAITAVLAGLVLLWMSVTPASAEPVETQLSNQSVRALVGVGAGPGNYAVVAWIAAPPGVGSGPGGNVKSGPSRVMVAVRGRKGVRFRQPRRITPFNAEVASLAVSETGRTMVVWANRHGRIKARYRTPDRGWSKTMGVAGLGASAFPDSPSLDISEDGTAVVGWRSNWKRSAGAQMVAMFHPKQGFGRPIQVGPKVNFRRPDAGTVGIFHAVSARRGGKGTAVWLSSCGSNPKFFQPGWSVNLNIRQGATRPARIRSSKCSHAEVSLSENARGRAVLAINGHGFNSMVRLAVRPADKRHFRKAVRVTPKGLRASLSQVAVHANGLTTMVASMTDNQGPAGLLGVKFFEPRSLDPERNLISPPGTGGSAMGANNRGDVAVLTQSIQTRRWVYVSKPPTGPFTPSVELSFENYLERPVMTIDPSAVAVSRSGKAIAATARANWDEERKIGLRGIYIFDGLPRSPAE